MQRETKPKTIGIIGGGVTGLVAGCYARMNGYEADIFESHSLPGGLCTSWKKGDDYIIDGCIQWLVGVAPTSGFYKSWMEVGALQGKTIVHHDTYITYESLDGRRLILYSDVDRLEKHLLEFSPKDASLIRRVCSGIRLFARLDAKKLNGRDLLLSPYRLWQAGSAFLTSTKSLSKKFKDPFLRQVFSFEVSSGGPSLPAAILYLTLAWHNNRNGGYPIGGSLEFAKSIERRFKELGGVIHYLSKVDKILIHDHQAIGVKLANGSGHLFDRVLSAGDASLTFNHLLEGKYNGEKLYRSFKKLSPFQSMVVFSFGVRRDMTEEPQSLMLFLDEPLDMGGTSPTRMHVRHYAYDPTLAPPGRTVVEVGFEGNYDYWKKLHEDRVLYDSEKHELAEKVLVLLEKRFPGIGTQVEVTDVATPVTFERYTHNWRGSIEGWLPTFKSLLFPLPKKLSRLKGLYFAGQWVQPGGGLPTCLLTGKGIIKRICKEDHKPFVTRLPVEKPEVPTPKPGREPGTGDAAPIPEMAEGRK